MFVALKVGMEHAIPINVRDMAGLLALVVQLAPSTVWAAPMHGSGLFAYLVQALEEDKVGKLHAASSVSGSCEVV